MPGGARERRTRTYSSYWRKEGFVQVGEDGKELRGGGAYGHLAIIESSGELVLRSDSIEQRALQNQTKPQHQQNSPTKAT